MKLPLLASATLAVLAVVPGVLSDVSVCVYHVCISDVFDIPRVYLDN